MIYLFHLGILCGYILLGIPVARFHYWLCGKMNYSRCVHDYGRQPWETGFVFASILLWPLIFPLHAILLMITGAEWLYNNLELHPIRSIEHLVKGKRGLEAEQAYLDKCAEENQKYVEMRAKAYTRHQLLYPQKDERILTEKDFKYWYAQGEWYTEAGTQVQNPPQYTKAPVSTYRYGY
jgi:hypothetical protein